ncbi:MAG: hypothetical protein JSS36_01310 [Proteobacteria bacterium]|nr:hypothetical protein [Pseudomonadota bacterium]
MTAMSATLMLKAMDGLALRAQAIAQNIANASSPRYRPMAVTFEDALARAAAQGPEAVAAVTPQIVPEPRAFGQSGVRIDLELADASTTSGRYAALAELLNRRLQLEALAVSGTR